MPHEDKEIQDFVRDYERDFGVEMPKEDADRILTLYDEMSFLFEKHSPGEGFPAWFFLP
jgi:hypothetical protein